MIIVYFLLILFIGLIQFKNNDEKEYFESRILIGGDVILLASSGHGLKMLEESEILEVKQGPYLETEDKIKFEGISDKNIIIK